MVTAFSAKEIVCRGYNVISLRKSNKKYVTIVMNKTSYLKIVPDFKPTWLEYTKWYPVTVKGKKAIMYKAVHKTANGEYYSNFNRRFFYEIGKIFTEKCAPKSSGSCSAGLHVSHKSSAIAYGGWTDVALLECEVPVDKIVVSSDCDGKVRTSELKILREVPKDEWYGEL